MCGRYFTNIDIYAGMPGILDISADITDITGDIHPSDIAPVLSLRNGKSILNKMKWGYPAPGNKGLLINARIETIEEKPMFRQDFKYRRCVIPAAGFYEWDRSRQKATFTLPERQIIYLAGIYRNCEDMEHFTIITTQANASMSPIHDRMPFIIDEEQLTEWMGDGFRSIMSSPMPELDVSIENEQLSFI